MDPELLSVLEASELLGIGRSKLYELLAAERLEVVRIGRRALIPRAAVVRFVEELRADAEAATTAKAAQVAADVRQ